MNGRAFSGASSISGTRARAVAIEALHVAGAAAIEPVVTTNSSERIGGPGLAVDRHDIGMAGQHNAAGSLRADAGVKVRLLTVGIRHDAALDAESRQIVATEMDELEIAALRFRVERDQLGEHVLGRQGHNANFPVAGWLILARCRVGRRRNGSTALAHGRVTVASVEPLS